MSQEEKINSESTEATPEVDEAKGGKPARQSTLVIGEDGASGGVVRISQNVIARIITRNVLAIDGVARFAPKGVADLVNIFSDRSYDSSILIEFKDDKVYVTLAILVYFGAVIPEVVKKVQQTVREQIECYAGAKLGKVDVLVKDLVEPESKTTEESSEVEDGEEAAKAEEPDAAL